MSTTYYERLGVSPLASAEEIRHAWRTHAQLVHPDHHTAASAEVRAMAEVEMKWLNEALDTLIDPERRYAYDVAIGASPRSAADEPVSPSASANEQRAQPSDTSRATSSARGCERCGTAIAARCVSERHAGMLLARRHWTRDMWLCAACGTRQLCVDTAVTALIGWWGLISMFVTPVTILKNTSAAYAFAQRIPKRSRQLPPFALAALVLIAGVIVAVLVFAIVAGMAGTGHSPQSQSNY